RASSPAIRWSPTATCASSQARRSRRSQRPEREPAVSAAKPSLSACFIRHPVSTALLTLAVVLLGVADFPLLPVASLPDAEYPTTRDAARLPGASPETIASLVATPLEVELSAVPVVAEMSSTSNMGPTSVTLQFALEKD